MRHGVGPTTSGGILVGRLNYLLIRQNPVWTGLSSFGFLYQLNSPDFFPLLEHQLRRKRSERKLDIFQI
jgi:hypothetical protein